MGMPKFFFDKKDRSGGQICLHGEDEKHIKTVLRAKEGEELTLCDGEGMDYQCRISSLEDGVQLEVLSQAPCETEPKTKITLYQGLPKADNGVDYSKMRGAWRGADCGGQHRACHCEAG